MGSPKHLKPKTSKVKRLPKYPLFSFQRTSLSGNYSFEFFGNDHRCQNQAYSDWIRHLHTWSSVTMTELGRVRKTEGFETLPLSRFEEPVQNLIKSPEYTKDTKLTVFWFNGVRAE